MATKKELYALVEHLNNKYCKNTKNHLVVSQAYGGYSVELTGKYYKRGSNYHRVKNSISGAASIGNPYHDTATNTITSLLKADSRGYIKSAIRHYENKKYW